MRISLIYFLYPIDDIFKKLKSLFLSVRVKLLIFNKFETFLQKYNKQDPGPVMIKYTFIDKQVYSLRSMSEK